jgi:uncharacterized protein (DUF433 family)
MQPPQILDRGRGPELAGTRITVFDVIPYLRLGWCEASIAILFSLSTDQVRTLVEYIEQHKDEVMTENAKIEARIAHGNPAEIEEQLRNSPVRALLRARLEEVRRNRAQEVNGASDPER